MQLNRFVLLSIALVGFSGSSLAAEALHVRHDHDPWGSCTGELTIASDGIRYHSDDKDEHSRDWSWTDIQTVDRLSADRFSILTYQDQKWLLGRDRPWDFTVLDPGGRRPDRPAVHGHPPERTSSPRRSRSEEDRGRLPDTGQAPAHLRRLRGDPRVQPGLDRLHDRPQGGRAHLETRQRSGEHLVDGTLRPRARGLRKGGRGSAADPSLPLRAEAAARRDVLQSTQTRTHPHEVTPWSDSSSQVRSFLPWPPAWPTISGPPRSSCAPSARGRFTGRRPTTSHWAPGRRSSCVALAVACASSKAAATSAPCR